MLNICGTYDEDIYYKFKKKNNVYYNERLRFEKAERRKIILKVAEITRKNQNRIKTIIMKISKTYVIHMMNIWKL